MLNKKLFFKTISLLLLFVCGIFLFLPADAAPETRNYGWTLGKYDTVKQAILPSNTSSFWWNGMNVKTIGPWSVNVGGSRVGSVINFVDINRISNNGYPMVGEPQWDEWISFFKGNPNFVKDNLNTWDIDTFAGRYKFANFAQLVELCGGKGGDFSVSGAWSNFYRSNPPYTTLLADKTQVNVGDTVTFTLKAQTNTYWGQYLDISFAGGGKSYINNKRYNEVHPIITQEVTFTQKGTFLFRLTARDSVWRQTSKEIYIGVGETPPPPPPPSDPPPNEPPPEPINQPPVARFTWPSSCYETDTVDVKENSYDPDGEIVKWTWALSPTSETTATLGQGGGTVNFTTSGTYNLKLTVKDDDGDSASITRSINVLKPVPNAVIKYSGTLKENRKVTLSSQSSYSPAKFPIDHSLDEWTITPLSGGVASDIKWGAKSGSTQDVLFKKAGIYQVGLKVHNDRYPSEWAYQNIVIIPDDPPVANFTVPAILFRNPADSSYATINLSDKSFSFDGDIISQRIWRYKFDSNNDGSFLDETWVDLDTGNNQNPLLRVDHVGKYLFSLDVKEDFGQETIPEFINDTDYRTANTTTKPEHEKITEIKNIPPVTSFTARLKPKADIVFIKGDAEDSKLANLDTQIKDIIKPRMLAKDIDANIQVLDTGSFGPNIAVDPSLEGKETDWVFGGGSVRAPGQWYTNGGSEAHSGNVSLLLDIDGTKWSYGITQPLRGYKPGEYVEIAAWIKVEEYIQGTIVVDLYGTTNNGYLWDPVGAWHAYGTTNGWVRISAVEQIPTEGFQIDRLRLRVFADNYPIMKAYIDDISVRKVLPNKKIEDVITESVWTNDINRFVVNISDTQNVSDVNKLVQTLGAGVNYSTLGTDANKAQSENIITLNSGKGIFLYNHNMATRH